MKVVVPEVPQSVSFRSMSHTCHTQQRMTHKCWHIANRLLLLYTVSKGGGLVYEV